MKTEASWYEHLDVWKLVFWGTVLLAIVLRFYDLGSKPLHHDESLYGVYCWRFFQGEPYKYDPMMHGPFMFHFQLLIFFLFGVGDFSVRIAPALFGCLMIASTYYLKDLVGKTGVIIIALLLTCSPTHLYFSRFMRHDMYIAFFTYLAAIFGLWYYRTQQKSYLYLTAAALSLMFCVKENAYIHTFIFVTFFILKEFCQAFFLPVIRYTDKFWDRLKSFLSTQKYPLIFAAFIFMWIYIILYTTFFTNLGGFLDGLYRKSLTYWWEQHSIQRIKGPFHYYVPFFVLYEFPVVMVLGLFIFGNMLKKAAANLNTRILAGWATIFASILLLFFGDHSVPEQIAVGFLKTWAEYILVVYILWITGWAIFSFFARHWNTALDVLACCATNGFLLYMVGIVYFLPRFGHYRLPLWFAFTHMEIWADLILTISVLGIGLGATCFLIIRRRTRAAFFAYWAAIGFLIYSYAGEKVPWLFLHILIPVILLTGILLNDFFRSAFWRGHSSLHPLKIAVLALCVLSGGYTIHNTVLLNYYHPANPVETMVYTQTSTDILKMLEVIRDVKFQLGAENGQKPIIAVQGNAVWPLYWYLRDYESWYYPGDLYNVRRPMMIVDWESRDKYQDIFAEAYQEVRVKLREWWIPEPGATLREWWRYFMYREIFNPTGSSDIAFYVRKSQEKME